MRQILTHLFNISILRKIRAFCNIEENKNRYPIDHVNLYIRICPWYRKPWFGGTLIFITGTAVSIGLLTDAPNNYIFGQMALGLSAFIAFGVLADRPLINPLQALVASFYWWFGIAPAAVAAFHYLMGMPNEALEFEISGMEAVWIVAVGLPPFAIAARTTMQWLEKVNIGATFLLPKNYDYSARTIVVFFMISFGAGTLLILLDYFGIQGQEQTSFLGGKKTNIWWIGAIDNLQMLSIFTNSALMVALSESWNKVSWKIKLLGIAIIIQTTIGALTSGWKSQFVFLGLYMIIGWVSRKQRLPWVALIMVVLVYLIAVEPFVTYGRNLSVASNVLTTEEREDIFIDLVKSGYLLEKRSISEINVESPFRGIYALAGDITRNSTLFWGEYGGYTILWGIEAIVPRLFLPDKRDLNIGNFYYHNNYSRAYGELTFGEVTNFATSVPFDFVANYGWLAGALWFLLFGIFWSVFCGWILTPDRLHSHPLTPMMVGFATAIEQPFGHWLASIRGLIIPLVIAYIIYRLLNRSV